MRRVVAMHQPTFLPWLGWWDKLLRADVFVLLDAVQFPKKGGTWMNRVRVLVNGEPTWLTIPIDRSHHGLRTVRETRILDGERWRERIARTISTAYRRAPFFDEVWPVVERLLAYPTAELAALNEHAIRGIAAELGLDAGKIVRQSTLDVEGRGTELLIALTRAVGGNVYMTGDGSAEYLEPERFPLAGLALEEQRFTSPVYRQQSPTFVAGLSVVDAAMSCGWRGTAQLLRARAS